MSLKPCTKHFILWFTVIFIGLLAMAIVLVPPMISLNKLKPKIQDTIFQQTGVQATINGNINFSLLGGATIVAHDVTIPIGYIKNISFTIPFRSLFNIASAPFDGDISINGGNFQISNIQPTQFNHTLDLRNTTVNFKDKDYKIIRAKLKDGALNGTVRTSQHKYDISFQSGEFIIRNKNDNLEITGQLYSDGTARGQITIETQDINQWFEFSEPKINHIINLAMNFDWDGDYGFTFSNIDINNKITGNIELMPDGARNIQLSGTDVTFDMSFLMEPTNLFLNTKFDLDFYGDLKFDNYDFHHIKIIADGSTKRLNIDTIIADNIKITGGTIDGKHASNILISAPYEGIPAQCLFSGTPQKWSCKKFIWGKTVGSVSVEKDTFNLTLQSPDPMPNQDTIIHHVSNLGHTGHIDFSFSNMAGTLDITRRNVTPHYTFAQDKTLQWLNPNFKLLPKFMYSDIGDFIWRGDTMDFNPHNHRWFLSLSKNRFFLSGTNIKDLFPNLDLQSIRDMEYTITGAYNRDTISDLTIKIAGHEFTGRAEKNKFVLKTSVLNLDTFINQSFLDNYEELSFLTTSPITIPFNINANVSLSADAIIYNGDRYSNFVYSLKPNTQTFSISDNLRGNLLAIIEKNKTNYDISLQMNKFVTHGTLLQQTMPLNISDTTITADIELKTSGLVAHDQEYNLSGTLNLVFDNGYITGLGIDEFYAATPTLTQFTAEYALSNALEQGKTQLKTMHIIGKYENGNFQTTEPIVLKTRHTDISGDLEIVDGNMQTTLNLILRGTTPNPAPIILNIAPDNSRNYPLSDIMRNLDLAFMQAFIQTHNRF